ncbi:hypothetical protein Poly21_02380 [Allorhodopirellula heiligendammensis]|uniref:Cytochrome c domain-containing protein n=1 Tax=Allorhodopirellula heiligendammensis TaxID=2714739 RepID=A0A5C6C0K1_9BACT|nr:hypothetical protein Poly21_02380 [Allorhodopirellula heiligendammensis]
MSSNASSRVCDSVSMRRRVCDLLTAKSGGCSRSSQLFTRKLFVKLYVAVAALLVSIPPGADHVGAQEQQAFPPERGDFMAGAERFLSQHCIRCHGPELAEANFRVDHDLTDAFGDRVTAAKWADVVEVLNGHQMPPNEEPQPDAAEVALLVDGVTTELIRAEASQPRSVAVLRRLNRSEYHHTIRDLVGVDFDTSHLPPDPATGGFDNNGDALTMSPLLMEMYFDAATRILDQALVEGNQPRAIRWRFEPESGNSDRNRVTYDGQRVIVNGGKNRVEGDYIVMHHGSWDRKFNVRDFRLTDPGKYRIRIRAGTHVPDRQAVLASAETLLTMRLEDAIKRKPQEESGKRKELARQLEHFKSFPAYNYGPARVEITRQLGGQPERVAEFDIDAPIDEMSTYEFDTVFSNQDAGLTIEYAYAIPRELENFQIQWDDRFARPVAGIDWMEIEGPIYEQWPPESHLRLLFPSASRQTDERLYARQVITRFLQRAYRRPADAAEIDSKMLLFDEARKHSKSFQDAIRMPLTAILVSPNFLYLAEPQPQSVAEKPKPLHDYEVAARISYFLWSSMPDDDLFRAANRGELRTREGLNSQVARMLRDPKTDALVTNFAGQWLGLREVGANPPARQLYHRYDRHLELSIVEESLAFFREVLQEDLSVMNFVDSDFVVINERLARFYGIEGVRGDHFRRVVLPTDCHRGGVLTQASMLSLTSNGTRTSPVKRGVWILNNILGIDPGLPVADAGDIAPKVPGIDLATVRERLEIHRELPQCARCHNQIDPLGFALENFDASGAWREREGHGYEGKIRDNDPLIDASSQLPDGTTIAGLEELKSGLMRQQDAFLHCLAAKMLTYALGRELGITDRPLVDDAVKHMKSNALTLRSLIEFVVQTETFRMQRM